MPYDFVQNSQVNSNSSSWYSLHGAVRNIHDLTETVGKTNNEAHEARQKAEIAIAQAKAAIERSNHLSDNFQANSDELKEELQEYVDRTLELSDQTHDMHQEVRSLKAQIEAHTSVEISNMFRLTNHVERLKSQVEDYKDEVKGHFDNLPEIPDVSDFITIEDVNEIVDPVEASVEALGELVRSNHASVLEEIQNATQGLPEALETIEGHTGQITDLQKEIEVLKNKEPDEVPPPPPPPDLTGYATETYVDEAIINFVPSDEVNERIEASRGALQGNVDTLNTKVEGYNTTLAEGLAGANTSIVDLSRRVTVLEDKEPPVVVPPPVEPEEKVYDKFYVLAVIGQSNSVGYGEQEDTNIENHPRIKQLGQNTITAAQSGYDNIEPGLHRKLRPEDNCWNKIIPAVPCLDHHEIMFGRGHKGPGGIGGPGYYIARRLLNHIPKDYGILIVPGGHGSSGFEIRGAKKNWLPADRAGTTGIRETFKSRLTHALNLNPANKLLPIIWIQGEEDASVPNTHYTEFKNLYEDLRDTFAHRSAGYGQVDHKDDFRMLCMGSTKWLVNTEMDWSTETPNIRDYVNDSFDLSSRGSLDGDYNRHMGRLAVYDNYVYLQQEAEKEHNGVNKSGYGAKPLFTRIDTQHDGMFVSTDTWYPHLHLGMGDIHFSTEANAIALPQIAENSILAHSRSVYGPMPSLYRYPLRGGPTAFTDGVKVYYSNIPSTFDVGDLNIPVTERGSFTIHVISSFKSLADRLSDEYIVKTRDDLHWFVEKHVGVFMTRHGPNNGVIPFSAALTGAWQGGMLDAQHFTVTWDKDFEIYNAYLNGKLIHTQRGVTGLNATDLEFKEGSTGGSFGRALNPMEVYALYLKDRPEGHKF